MDIGKLIDPLENRFKLAEAETIKEACSQSVYGTLKSFLRGGVIGAGAGALSGDSKYVLILAGLGAAIDGAQDALRKIHFISMRRQEPEKYLKLKEDYSRIFGGDY